MFLGINHLPIKHQREDFAYTKDTKESIFVISSPLFATFLNIFSPLFAIFSLSFRNLSAHGRHWNRHGPWDFCSSFAALAFVAVVVFVADLLVLDAADMKKGPKNRITELFAELQENFNFIILKSLNTSIDTVSVSGVIIIRGFWMFRMIRKLEKHTFKTYFYEIKGEVWHTWRSCCCWCCFCRCCYPTRAREVTQRWRVQSQGGNCDTCSGFVVFWSHWTAMRLP